MKKLFLLGLALAIAAAPANAQNGSAKNAIQVSSMDLIGNTAGQGWTTILGDPLPWEPDAIRIHTSQQKDLIIVVSLECGLYTQTSAKSKGNTKDTSSATATVEVQVLVDGNPIHPGTVTFCHRYQELSATLQGILEVACEDTDDDGYLDECNLNVLSEEEIELIQKTLNANAFIFAMDDLGAGNHYVEVQARVSSATTNQNGSASAWGMIGKGAVSVEEVRLLKGAQIDIGL